MQQSINLHKTLVNYLQKEKNLLAFSAGIDSTALFFILKEHKIDFDIAIVNYNTREQSREEVEYAKELAKRFNKEIFIHSCSLENSNFEHNARVERYSFFEKIISENGYKNLITAHQLNDKLEWFLMQLGKGSGLVELLGMQESEKKENYYLIKPLLETSKEELLDFLTQNSIRYFFDKSNVDEKYFRNKIRNRYADSFVKEYKDGLKKSFKYLQNDKKLLLPKEGIRHIDLFILHRDDEELRNIRQIDRAIKKLGVLMSEAQRREVLRTEDCVISDKIVVSFTENFIYIAPFRRVTMPKKVKERYRIEKIPSKIRPYLYENSILTLESIHKLLS